eukprot:CAMPEP_0174969308 /NCGR_PEP_ID=MMETSP0004_2-20121128/8680_1 /TAXON_ID=420556 /ORGANISM="Ochromonas sp., Strain CCMP1393" /LENGTH=109 /DNA_ID=CAMNT_0016218763 /DNA_START=163 /DNA_END=492 /DNA_ORIENTATION=+
MNITLAILVASFSAFSASAFQQGRWKYPHRNTPAVSLVPATDAGSIVSNSCNIRNVGTKRRGFQLAMADSEKKKEGVEPKYLAAAGVFVLACLYDFFITHNGQVYLGHP